jgi:hypothetical protein
MILGRCGKGGRRNGMGDLRWNRAVSWIIAVAAGAVWAVYFLDATRYAALTQTAGWFLKAGRIMLAGGN